MTTHDPTYRSAVPLVAHDGRPSAPGGAPPRPSAAAGTPALGRRRWAVLAVLAAALLLVSVGAAILDLALPSLARDLAPSATELLWIVDVYSLVLAGLLVTMGTLGDRWGRKRLLLLGVGLFGAASLLAAFAASPALVILARAVQGIGGAMIMPATLSIVRATFVEPRERTLAVGVWTAVAGAGAAVGPILGGVLLERFWWGSTFLVNVPIMAAVLLLAARLLPESRAPGAGRWDLLSALLSIGGVAGVLYAIKEAAVHGPLDPAGLLVGLPGLLFLVLFVRRQRRLPQPLLDLRLFREQRFSAAVGSNALALFGLMGAFFFLSQHVQLVLGFGPLRAALALLPAMAGAVLAALLVGPAARRFGLRALVAGGLAAMAGGLGGVAVFGAERYADLLVALVPVGLGAGLAMTAASDAIIGALPPARSGAAAAISETGQELGTVLGVALLGSVMNAVYARSLGPVPGVAAELLAAARDGLPTAAEVAAALGGGTGALLRRRSGAPARRPKVRTPVHRRPAGRRAAPARRAFAAARSMGRAAIGERFPASSRTPGPASG
jgi:DHA2 family multidrug resistance protein-like MFS transporter